jgi:hypothetical protein
LSEINIRDRIFIKCEESSIKYNSNEELIISGIPDKKKANNEWNEEWLKELIFDLRFGWK